jgi:hypothetical protein
MEQITNIYNELQKDIKNGSDELSKYLDSIIVWIISLSTGSIALIFAAASKID